MQLAALESATLRAASPVPPQQAAEALRAATERLGGKGKLCSAGRPRHAHLLRRAVRGAARLDRRGAQRGARATGRGAAAQGARAATAARSRVVLSGDVVIAQASASRSSGRRRSRRPAGRSRRSPSWRGSSRAARRFAGRSPAPCSASWSAWSRSRPRRGWPARSPRRPASGWFSPTRAARSGPAARSPCSPAAPDSRDASSLPGRLEWTLAPRWLRRRPRRRATSAA